MSLLALKQAGSVVNARINLLALCLFLAAIILATTTNLVSAVPEPAINTSSSLPPLAVIKKLLTQQFKVVQLGVGGALSLVPRLNNDHLAEISDIKYGVVSAKKYDDKGFFSKHKIIQVVMSPDILDARVQSRNQSMGLFALNGSHLTYLNGQTSAKNLTSVLAEENRDLALAEVQSMAELFAATLLSQGNDRVDLVVSADDLLKIDKPNAKLMNEAIARKHLAPLYATTLNRPEWERCKKMFVKPQIIRAGHSGWKCVFIGLRGFKHTKRLPFTLVEYTILISPSYRLKETERVLSKDIFD
jgi:hypothetical protein